MLSCGKQCLICDYSVHMDTYRGCAHGCLYCATRKKYNIENVQPIYRKIHDIILHLNTNREKTHAGNDTNQDFSKPVFDTNRDFKIV